MAEVGPSGLKVCTAVFGEACIMGIGFDLDGLPWLVEPAAFFAVFGPHLICYFHSFLLLQFNADWPGEPNACE